MPDIKLTDTQRVILSAASARDSGLIFPLPKSLTTNKAAISKVFHSLLGKELISRRPAKLDEDAWEADGSRIALEITTDGLAAIGIESAPEVVKRTKSGKPRNAVPRSANKSKNRATGGGARPIDRAPKSTSKLGLIVAALRSRKGVTIDDLMEVTDWQAHSIRGAISGALKKKMGLKVDSSAVDGRGRVYRIGE